MPSVPPILFGISIIYLGIVTGNETSISYDILGDSLDLYCTTTPILIFSPKVLLTNVLLSVNIEALIISINGHENIVLHATTFTRENDTVIVGVCTKKEVLYVITVVIYTPPFPC